MVNREMKRKTIVKTGAGQIELKSSLPKVSDELMQGNDMNGNVFLRQFREGLYCRFAFVGASA